MPPTAGANPDRACISCGYSLRGLAVEGNCPECGTPVADSLRGTLLRHASPAYLAKVRMGIDLVLLGMLLTLLMTLVAVGAAIWMIALAAARGGQGGGMAAAPFGAVDRAMQLLLNFGGFAVACISLVGYLKLTTPDPQFAAVDQPLTARKFVRAMVIVQIATATVEVVLGAVAMGIPPTSGAMAGMTIAGGVSGVLQTLAWAAQFFAIMLYFRWLARRVPDAAMERQTRVYMWLLPALATVGAACVGIGPLVAAVLYCVMLWRLRGHVRAGEAGEGAAA